MWSDIVIYFILFALILYFLKSILNPIKWCCCKTCLVGKTALITGANRGLGYELALALAARGCRVIITCRRDGSEIREKIIKATGNCNITVVHLELASLASIRKLANEINSTIDRLDILVNNAAVGTAYEYTEDRLHPMMQTNYLGPFLLTHLLADLLKKSAPSRVIFVSSMLGMFSNFDIEQLNPPEMPLSEINNFKTMNMYNNSKLCQIVTTATFARKLSKFSVFFQAVHPGFVKTDIFRQCTIIGTPKWSYELFNMFVLNLFSKSVEEGIQRILHEIISQDMYSRTGEFCWDFGRLPTPWKARDEVLGEAIWEKSEQLVKLQSHEKL